MNKIVRGVYSILYKISSKLITGNMIVLEGSPDFSDNPRPVFDELIKQKINEKYKIRWIVNDKSKFKDIRIKNVKFVNRGNNKLERLLYLYIKYFSRYIIDSNLFIPKHNKDQFRIHLTHGMIIKIASDYCNRAGDFDYLVQTSDFFSDILCDLFLTTKDKIVTTGFPRNDDLFFSDTNWNNPYKNDEINKIIVWLPTYRNHKSCSGNSIYDMEINFPYGVPAINNENEIQEINVALKENKTLLLIKLHPAEDNTKIRDMSLSNVKLMDDSVFKKDNINLYKFLSTTDALITDYSSVYYDYLLTGKPIGVSVTDINEYKKHVNLLYDDFESNIVGEYINNCEDLKSFISNVASGNDVMKERREEKTKLYHKYCDANSAKRVVELLKQGFEKHKKVK